MIGIVIARTFIFYFLFILLFRLMGKREIAELNILDFVVFMIMTELVAISIENYDESIFLTIIPIIILVGLQVGLAFFTLKNKKARDLLEGKPTLIISEGKLKFKNMVKEKYNLNDLLMQLREKEIKSIEEVDYALLEPSGNLSVFKKEKFKKRNLPLPIITDGEIEEGTLDEIKKDKTWVLHLLEERNLDLKEIFYAFIKNKKLIIVKKSDLS